VPQDFTQADIGFGRRPRHQIYIEDIQEAVFSPVYETFTNAGVAGVDLLITVPAGYYAVVTHVALRRAALTNDVAYLAITRPGEDPTATWHMVAAEPLYSWVNATPANATFAPGCNLITVPLVLDEGDRLYLVNGAGTGADACQGRYVLIAKRGAEV